MNKMKRMTIIANKSTTSHGNNSSVRQDTTVLRVTEKNIISVERTVSAMSSYFPMRCAEPSPKALMHSR